MHLHGPVETPRGVERRGRFTVLRKGTGQQLRNSPAGGDSLGREFFLGREGGTVKKVRVAYEKSDCQRPKETVKKWSVSFLPC